MKRFRSTIALILAACSALAAALAGDVDKSASTVTATFRQMGVAVDARFTAVNGTIVYDPANAAAAKAQLSIDVASFDIGDAAYNQEVLKKEWFNAAQYPQATFTSTAIKAAAADTLQVQGRLTIKGRALDVVVPVKVTKNGARQVFSGALPIKRLYFNIGEGEWKDTSLVADEVTIKFSIAAAAQ